jgi:hypothetical protein
VTLIGRTTDSWVRKDATHDQKNPFPNPLIADLEGEREEGERMKAMEVLIGLLIYAVIIFGFVSFGKFMKECDNSMREQLRR